MDDTIFDHSLTCRRALALLRKSEPALEGRSVDDVWREYSRLLEAVQVDVLSGRVSVEAARTQRFLLLANFCGTSISSADAAGLSRRYRENYLRLRRTVPGIRRILERLRGRAVVGIVTNNQVAEQEEKLDHFRLRPLVDFMVVSEGVGVAKPDPRIFELALEKAGAAPHEAVMIGDSWTSDVVGARNVGIRPVWFNRFRLAAPEPWSVVELESYRVPAHVEAALAGGTGTPPTSR
jgi:5'-nucleotidase